jgi:Transposase IS116/IS110/IS902 family
VPTDRSRCHLNIEKGDRDMVILGIDAHKRTHTVVVIDERGRELGSKTTKATTTAEHLELLRWADVRRFKHKDAFARHNGTAPLPAWSGNPSRHRLSRTGNRQLNAAIHRIAITQLRYHDDARAFRDRRVAKGDTGTEALRALKRRLSDVVFRALSLDATPATAQFPPAA